MSITEKDMIAKTQAEIDQLVSAATACMQAIDTLAKRRAELENKLRSIERNDSSQQGEGGPALETSLRNELAGLIEQTNQKDNDLKEINEKLLLLQMNLKFQNDIMDLWAKEKYYRALLDEKGMTTNEALLQFQGYVVPVKVEVQLILSSTAKDYTRVGRQDIADLIMGLSNPSKRASIFAQARAFYDKAPDYNYGFILSLCYENGWGTEINKTARFEIEKRFAAENHPLALCYVAKEYFWGDEIQRDLKKSVENFERATCAEQQDFYYAYYLFGRHLIRKQNLDKDEITKGLRLLEIACEKNIDLACAELASYFNDKAEFLQDPQNNGSEADMKQAQERLYFYARKGNDLNIPLCTLLLSRCYAQGWGIEQDVGQFWTLINHCVTLGVDHAFESLAVQYRSGIEGMVEPNPIQALTLYFEAFRRNCSDFSLAPFKEFIEENQSNPNFMSAAYDLCKKCLEGHLLDNSLDSTVIGAFYQQSIFLPSNLERAIICFQKGADLGADESARSLILLSGRGESLGLLPPSIIAKYLRYSAEDDEVSRVREHYRSEFTPLFQALNESWEMIGLKSKGMVDGITKIIVDYAFTPLGAAKGDKIKI